MTVKKFNNQKFNSGFTPTPKMVSRQRFSVIKVLGSPSSRFWSSPIKTDTLRVRPKLTAGFTLIETFTAIIILLIAILGPLTLLSRAIGDGIYAQNKITASFLLQEGLDLTISHWEQLTRNPYADLSKVDIPGCSSANSACYVSVDGFGNVSFFQSTDYSICLVASEQPDQYFYQQNGNSCSSGFETIFTRKIWFEDIPFIDPDELYSFGSQIGKVAHVQVAWVYYKDKDRNPRITESSTILLK